MQSKEKLKVGVIGIGHQSLEDHIPSILASNDINLVAVCDVNKEKLKSFSYEHKDVHTYQRFKDLFQSEKLDFVIIAVPHCLHQEVVKEAIKYKIHILKEKPFAISLEQAKEIKTIAEQNNVKIMLTLQRRFNPIYSTFF